MALPPTSLTVGGDSNPTLRWDQSAPQMGLVLSRALRQWVREIRVESPLSE
jgi:hypothetical protein